MPTGKAAFDIIPEKAAVEVRVAMVFQCLGARTPVRPAETDVHPAAAVPAAAKLPAAHTRKFFEIFSFFFFLLESGIIYYNRC